MEKRKRFKRSEEVASRNNQYTPVDEAVLLTVSKHHYVRGTFIQSLLTGTPDNRTVRNSTRKLFDMGLLFKMSPQNFCYSHIYQITDAGLTALRKKSPQATNLIRHKGATLPTNYYHSLMICDITQNIELGATKYKDIILSLSEILERLTNPVKKPMSLPYTATFKFSDGKTSTFTGRANPDNALAIIYQQNGFSRLILIEAERESPDFRTTLQDGSLIRKILGYEDICRKPPKGKPTILQLGKYDCNVLFVYPTIEEATRACNKAAKELAKVLPSSPRYLFGVQPTQDDPMTDPKPNPAIYDTPLMRIGMEPICLKDLWKDE